MTTEQAMQVLRDAGYYVNNLWHVNDVKVIKPTINGADARNVLETVMHSQSVMDAIWAGIKEQVEETTL